MEDRTGRSPCFSGFSLLTVGDEGLEHRAESTGKTGGSQAGDAESDAFLADSGLIDSGLAAVVEAWPKLAEAIKAGILAMIQAAG